MRRYLPLLLLVAACGSTPAAPPASDGGPDLTDVAQAVRAAGSVSYDAVGTRKRPDRALETELTVRGRLDLRAGTGSAEVSIPAVGEELPRLTWDRSTVTAEVEGKRETMPRNGTDTALLARIPEEPAALLSGIAHATDVREEPAEQVPGTRHLTGLLDAQRAVSEGVGVQASEALKAGPPLRLDVWVGERDLPRRIRYRATLPALGILPEREVAVTYDYTGWGG